jgi:hypothetical protein
MVNSKNDLFIIMTMTTIIVMSFNVKVVVSTFIAFTIASIFIIALLFVNIIRIGEQSSVVVTQLALRHF